MTSSLTRRRLMVMRIMMMPPSAPLTAFSSFLLNLFVFFSVYHCSSCSDFIWSHWFPCTILNIKLWCLAPPVKGVAVSFPIKISLNPSYWPFQKCVFYQSPSSPSSPTSSTSQPLDHSKSVSLHRSDREPLHICCSFNSRYGPQVTGSLHRPDDSEEENYKPRMISVKLGMLRISFLGGFGFFQNDCWDQWWWYDGHPWYSWLLSAENTTDELSVHLNW